VRRNMIRRVYPARAHRRPPHDRVPDAAARVGLRSGRGLRGSTARTPPSRSACRCPSSSDDVDHDLRGLHALGDHVHLRDDLVDGLTLAELLADVAVAALGEMHVATRSPMPASPANVSSSRPLRHAQPAQLGQAPGDHRGTGVVASTEAVGHARRDGDHVLEHPPTSQPTTSGFVYTRNSSWKHLLQRGGDVVVVHGEHAGGGVAGQDLLGQVGAGEHADRVTGQDLLDQLAHAEAGAHLEALRSARSPAPTAAGRASPIPARPGSPATARPSPAGRPGERPPPGRPWLAAASAGGSRRGSRRSRGPGRSARRARPAGTRAAWACCGWRARRPWCPTTRHR
jgi:hypothetical protein